eukprot:2040897-Rhodomonas_salina.1
MDRDVAVESARLDVGVHHLPPRVTRSVPEGSRARSRAAVLHGSRRRLGGRGYGGTGRGECGGTDRALSWYRTGKNGGTHRVEYGAAHRKEYGGTRRRGYSAMHRSYGQAAVPPRPCPCQPTPASSPPCNPPPDLSMPWYVLLYVLWHHESRAGSRAGSRGGWRDLAAEEAAADDDDALHAPLRHQRLNPVKVLDLLQQSQQQGGAQGQYQLEGGRGVVVGGSSVPCGGWSRDFGASLARLVAPYAPSVPRTT